MPSNHIIVNVTPLLSQLTGVGQYTFEISVNLKKLIDSEKLSFYPDIFPSLGKNVPSGKRSCLKHIKNIVSKSVFLRKAARKTLYTAGKISNKHFDTYFEPNFIPSLPYKYNNIVTTVHDFSFHKHPEYHPKERVSYFKNAFWNSIYKSDKIITVSEYIRQEAICEFNIDKETIETIHNGVNHNVFNTENRNITKVFIDKFPFKSGYILFTGTMEPRKNIRTLVEAYLSLPDAIQKEYPLVLVGATGWNNKDILKNIKNDRIHFLGYVTQDVLSALYNHATCFVYIPWYEGFGMPPIEAMACGCPCIVSNAASIPEVCGDAPRYVSPGNVEEIREEIVKIITSTDLRQTMSRQGLQQSQKYSWERSAEEHARVLQF